MSFAVIKDGGTRTYHVGLRDMDRGLELNDQTRYNINSLTKGLVSALVGIQIHDNRTTFDWSTPIKDVWPDFGGSTLGISGEATIVDLLSHHWGTSGFDDFSFGSDNAAVLPRSEALRTAASLPPASPFRTGFEYNNWAYEIGSQLLEASSGQDIATLLDNKLFRPLGMSKSSMSWDPSDTNEAKSYGVLFNKTCIQAPAPFNNNSDLMMKAAGGVKSTLEDMVIFYKAWMKELVCNSTAQPTALPCRRCATSVPYPHSMLDAQGPLSASRATGLAGCAPRFPVSSAGSPQTPSSVTSPQPGKAGPQDWSSTTMISCRDPHRLSSLCPSSSWAL